MKKILTTVSALAFLLVLIPSHAFAAITYATWDSGHKSSLITLTNGSLTATGDSSGAWGSVDSTISVSSGEWYWEDHVDNASAASVQSGITSSFQASPQDTTAGYSYYISGSKVNNSTPVAYGASYTTGDYIGIAYNADAGTLTFYKNCASQGTAYTGLSGPFYAYTALLSSGTVGAVTANFGATAFHCSVPSGYNPGLYSGSASGPLQSIVTFFGW